MVAFIIVTETEDQVFFFVFFFHVSVLKTRFCLQRTVGIEVRQSC